MPLFLELHKLAENMDGKEELLGRGILRRGNIAFHGTSIECLNEIIRDGHLNPGSQFSYVKSRLEAIFSDGSRTALNNIEHEPDFITLHGAFSYGKDIARARSFYDFMNHEAGLADVLEAHDEEYENLFSEGRLNSYDRRRIIRIGLELGHNRAELQEKIDLAVRRRGAVIGISHDFFSDKEFKDFEFDSYCFSYPRDIKGEEVISTNYINAIYIPRSSEMREFLASGKK